MKMELISLTMENFKCFEKKELYFDGKSANLYGDNGAGKTSVKDAFTWLLFGKVTDGEGGAGIKPTGEDGQVRDHGAVTAVEAVLRMDGVTRKLKRTYYEVWSVKRGSGEATFDGHSSDYFVDDVPVKKSEFARRVGELIDEKVFRLLTDRRYFTEVLPWQERRALLFELASVVSDGEIMASDGRFAALADGIQGLALDDFRKKLNARRKGLNGVRSDIPARLDECRKTVEDLSGIDFARLEGKQAEIRARREKLQEELCTAHIDGTEAALRVQLVEARNELKQLENENTAHRLRQEADVGRDGAEELRNRLAVLRTMEKRREDDLKYLRGREDNLEKDIAACRARWDEIDREQFTGGVCPTCGQNLPQDKLEAALACFERDRQDRKSRSVEAANRAKSVLAELRADIAGLEKEADRDRAQMEELSLRLAEAEAAPRAEITDLEGYGERKAELAARAEELEKELAGLGLKSAARRSALRDKAAELDRELDRLGGELAKKAALMYAQSRRSELMEQAAKAAEELNEVDKLLALCEEFLRYKARFVEESINRRFELVKFRLFREQINGGLEDCCDVTVGGVPYGDGLNKGARFNAGIDIINTLSRHFGAQVPLFVDDAESVTRLLPAETQVIRLEVSKNDKELRCELT